MRNADQANPVQTRALILLVLAGLLYFGAFFAPNLLGAKTEEMLSKTSGDETITYPYVVRMITPAKDLRELVNRWIIYGDYHYGYPFYFFSAVAVLPVRLVHGSLFENFTQINLLLLRQFISVLPMILAAGLLVFSQTGFRSTWKSLFLFILLLSIPAVVRNNIQWWHPDALSILAVVLTLFWLNRDQLRFGRNYHLAAVACGFAFGIKLAGAFFAPVIAIYLVAGWLKKKISLRRAILQGLIFLALMTATVLVTNPFLFNAGARQEMLNIQSFKQEELSLGYGHDDPTYYQKGPAFWEWTLRTWYADILFLVFIAASLLFGCFWGTAPFFNRLVAAWALPFSVYLLWFVAVKPDHYWLPVLVPVFSGALNLWDSLPGLIGPGWVQRLLRAGVVILLIVQIGVNLARPYSGMIARFQEGMAVEQAAPLQ